MGRFRRGSFLYEYEVTKSPQPRCVAGARACPPEDCGGAGGYESLLEALANPDHEDHESMMTWSDNFKPERFTLPKNGLQLRREMERLHALAESDDLFDGYEDGDGPLIELPRPLVEAVLALPPIQRASLGALIAGSLADEVEQARAMIDEVVRYARPVAETRPAWWSQQAHPFVVAPVITKRKLEPRSPL